MIICGGLRVGARGRAPSPLSGPASGDQLRGHHVWCSRLALRAEGFGRAVVAAWAAGGVALASSSGPQYAPHIHRRSLVMSRALPRSTVDGRPLGVRGPDPHSPWGTYWACVAWIHSPLVWIRSPWGARVGGHGGGVLPVHSGRSGRGRGGARSTMQALARGARAAGPHSEGACPRHAAAVHTPRGRPSAQTH